MEQSLFGNDVRTPLSSQNHTSKNTSLNQVPLAYSDKGRTPIDSFCLERFGKKFFVKGNVNFEQGMGKYNVAQEKLESLGITNRGTDPFNRTIEYNMASISGIKGNADTTTAINVLNVIDSDEVLDLVIAQAALSLKDDGIALFQVYECDASGVQKETKSISSNGGGQWQRCWKTVQYIPFAEKYFNRCFRYKNFILCDGVNRKSTDDATKGKFIMFE